MALQEELRTQGEWLFRKRSYLPLAFLVVLALGVAAGRYPGGDIRYHELWEVVCLGVSALGLFVRVLAVGFAPAHTSGRTTGQPTAASLTTSGVYSVVRHPIYVGNFLVGLGFALVPWVWWVPVIYTLLFCIYYERIMFAEEAFLRERFAEKFEEWAAHTPAVIPRFSQWRRPALAFSLRTVLRREYSAWMAVVAGHFAIELLEHLFGHDYHWEASWFLLVGTGGAVYTVLWVASHYTRLLEAEGR
ncbi:MAG TPA: isoprenylcysteine carboxylmethyltransferase family protein [Gemmatimonadaceae bacterium]|nr:isoprenylcysteine carboxylmethyltransferase family protein [Gemmatimonadaceae bacterium]